MARLILVEDLAGPAVRGRGGHAMYVLQTLIGLERLGHRVVFVECLDAAPDAEAVASFTSVTGRWWRPDRSALLAPDGRVVAGMSDDAFEAAVEDAHAVITLAAHYRAAPWPRLERVRPRILIEQDPGYTHLWADGGDPNEVFGEHDVYFTVGALVGTPGCRVPTLGIEWRPYVNPVVLDLWSGGDVGAGGAFGTVAGLDDYGWLEFEGRMLGPKVEELRAFAALPRVVGERFDLVAELEPGDPDRDELEAQGWRFRAPESVADPARFRSFVLGSAGEFSVAKGGYVGTHCGWFSDRSACFLAAGRPVILQATGFEDVLPTGQGLFAVHDVDEAARAVRAIRAEPARHAAAARRVAHEYFDSNTVLTRMLETAGVPTPA
jgi:hypothetical protein